MMLQGPQSDRERSFLLSSRSKVNISRDNIISDKELENSKIIGELLTVRKENSLLSEQLKRTLTELKLYQTKYPSIYFPDRDESVDLPTWTNSVDAFGPLFDSYDTRIKELEDVINLNMRDLNKFQELFDIITKENEELRDININNMEKSINKSNKNSNILDSELNNELNDKINILISENNILIEQKQLLFNELEKYSNEVNKLNGNLVINNQKIDSLSNENKQLKDLLVNIESDRNDISKQLLTFQDHYNKLSSENENYINEITILKQTNNKLTNAIKSIESNNNQMNTSYNSDINKYMKTLKLYEERINELQTNLSIKSQESDNISDILRKLKREYNNTRQDAEAMLLVMNSLEKQLSEYSLKEKDVEELAKECNFKLNEALSIRDQAVKREENALREVERILEEKKLVIDKIFNESSNEIELIKNKSDNKIKNISIEMQKMSETIAKLQIDSERSSKESKTWIEQLDKLKKSYNEEKLSIDESMKLLNVKIQELIIEKEDEYQKRVNVQDINKDLRLTIDKLRSQVDTLKLKSHQMSRSIILDNDNMKNTINELNNNLSNKNKTIEKLKLDIENYLTIINNNNITNDSKIADELTTYRRRAVEAEKQLLEQETNKSIIDSKNWMLIDKIKENSNGTIKYMESQLFDQISKFNLISNKNSELKSDIEQLNEEREQLLHVIDESKNTINRLQSEINDLYSTNSKLMEQLLMTQDSNNFDINNNLYE